MTHQSDAKQIIDAIDTRIDQSLKSGAHIEVTYGKVYSVAGRRASVLVGGETDPVNVSTDFRIPGHLIVQVNDPVRVAISDRGHKWIEEVIPVLAAPKIAINVNTGQIFTGDGTVEPATPFGISLSGGLFGVGSGVASSVVGFGGARALELDSAPGSVQTQQWLKVAGTGRAILRADSGGNAVLSGSGTGGTYISWDGGSGGTIFGNGAGVRVATIDNLGTLQFGSAQDTNLFRASANLLKTDDDMHVTGLFYIGASALRVAGSATDIQFTTNSGSAAVKARFSGVYVGENYGEPAAPSTGIQFGPDVNLYRGAANVLYTDDGFRAPSGQVEGNSLYSNPGPIYSSTGLYLGYAAGGADTLVRRQSANRVGVGNLTVDGDITSGAQMYGSYLHSASDIYTTGYNYFWGGSSWDTWIRRDAVGRIGVQTLMSNSYIYEHGGYQVPAIRTYSGTTSGAWIWLGTVDPGPYGAGEGDIWIRA